MTLHAPLATASSRSSSNNTKPTLPDLNIPRTDLSTTFIHFASTITSNNKNNNNNTIIQRSSSSPVPSLRFDDDSAGSSRAGSPSSPPSSCIRGTKARGTRLSDFDTDSDSDTDEESWDLTPQRRRRRRLQREEPVWPSSGNGVDDEDGGSMLLRDMLLRELREAWGRNQRGDGVVDEHEEIEVRVWRGVMRRWGEGVVEGRMGVRRPEALRGKGSLLRFCEGVGGLEDGEGGVDKEKGDGKASGFGGEVDRDVRDGGRRGLGQMNGAGEKRGMLWRKRIWKGFKGLVGKRS
ncbi:MAG: hypothetical protein LQ345_002161 [Seirophora villosa]|nr:MAG: hypothetical protein LQ345_002161 [Seirophora villosa]